MKWRIVAGVLAMFVCLMSWEKFSSSGCEPYIQLWGLIIGLLAVVSIVPITWAFIWKHTVYKHGNFQLSCLNQLPLNQYEADALEDYPWEIKVIPTGPQKLLIRVKSEYGFPVKKVNWRCLNKDSSEPPRGLVTVTDVEDPYHVKIFGRLQDGHFGIDGEYTDMRSLAEEECLYYIVTINGEHDWSGVLSFRAQDFAGFRSYAKRDLEIKSAAKPSTPVLPHAGLKYASPSDPGPIFTAQRGLFLAF